MSTAELVTLLGVLGSLAVPLAALIWFVLTHLKEWKKIFLAGVITVAVVAVLLAGVTIVIPKIITSPTPLTYATASPGNGCDTHGGIWLSFESTAHCTAHGTVITKTSSIAGNFGGWGEQLFQIPGQVFPASYTLGVTISGLTDPDPNIDGACAGFAIHLSQDRASTDHADICANGKLSIISIRNGQLIQVVSWQIRPSTAYVLTARATPTTITLAVNDEQYSAPAYFSETSYIGLVVFWEHAGAAGTFKDFSFASN